MSAERVERVESAGRLPSTMRAVVQKRYGTVEDWQLEQVAVPTPGAEEVLVAVEAAGIDRGTWHVMTGRPYLARLGLGLRRPRTRVPGLDLAGTVAAVGTSVTRFAVGDPVLGIARGSLADYALVPEKKLSHRPHELAPAEAAMVPVSGLTALQALDKAGVGAESRVLVLGASGGVGSWTVQLAVAAGAEVTGVCSGAKAAYVESLGASRVLDYARDDLGREAESYDAVLDIAGHRSLSTLRRLTVPGGTVVIVGSETGGRWTGGLGRSVRGALLSPFVSGRIVMLVAGENHIDLDRIVERLAAGEVRAPLDRTFPLEQAADAMRLLESGQVRGKAAVVP